MQIKQGFINKQELELNYIEISLKNTTLLLLEKNNAFFMCGALDPSVYKDREVICGRALGVKTIEELLNAKIVNLSNYAFKQGLNVGMTVYEAFKELSKKE